MLRPLLPAPAVGREGGPASLARTSRSPGRCPVQPSKQSSEREVEEDRKVSRAGALPPSPPLLLWAWVDSSLGLAALSPGLSIAHWALPLAHIFPASVPSSCPARHPGNGGGNGITQIMWEVPISHAQSWGLPFLPTESNPQPRPGSPLGSVPVSFTFPWFLGRMPYSSRAHATHRATPWAPVTRWHRLAPPVQPDQLPWAHATRRGHQPGREGEGSAHGRPLRAPRSPSVTSPLFRARWHLCPAAGSIV